MSEALAYIARQVDDLLHARDDYLDRAAELVTANLDEPPCDEDGVVRYFPWPPSSEPVGDYFLDWALDENIRLPESFDREDPATRQAAMGLALTRAAFRLTPSQVAYALVVLREVYCRGGVNVVAQSWRDHRSKYRAVGWCAAVNTAQKFGDTAVPWFTALLTRFEQILSSYPAPAGEAHDPAPAETDIADSAFPGADPVADLPTTAETVVRAAPSGPCNFRRCGANWEIEFGSERGSFPAADFSGLAILAQLIARPNHEHTLQQLVGADPRAMLEDIQSQGAVLDGDALNELRGRYDQLLRDKATSQDPLVQKEIETEYEQILAELKYAQAPGGRVRRLGTTQPIRAWEALKRLLSRKRLYDRLTGMPKLALHLEQAVKFSRPTVSYAPPPDSPPWGTGSSGAM